MSLFITAIVWFCLGFAFHTWRVWYDKRQERREWHDGFDAFLADFAKEQRKARNRERVLDAVREIADIRDIAWKN